jgi:type II secretory pathway component GspD/PulD (secretin)
MLISTVFFSISANDLRGEETSTPREASKSAKDSKEPLKLSMDFSGKSLKEVAERLSAAAGCSIRVLKESDEKLIVNFKAENMTCREILSDISKKYGMTLDDTESAKGILKLNSLEKVTGAFKDNDLRDLIKAIAGSGGYTVVIDPSVRGDITITFTNMPWKEALNVIAKSRGLVIREEANKTLQIKDKNAED